MVVELEDTTRVSCIIPTHGRDDMLACAIESCLAQEPFVAEVIVVDDLSLASTRETALRYSTPDLPVVYVDGGRIESPGAAASRNLGASHARSKLLAFLDDDDEWRPGYLGHSVRELVRRDLDFVVAWTQFARGSHTEDGQRMPEGLSSESALGRNPGLTGSNVVVRTSAFNTIEGFDESLWVSNDQDFLIRLLDSGCTYGVNQNEYVVQRGHDRGQLTGRTERRARGLEAYRSKYAHRLSARDRRLLARAIYSVRRVSSERLTQRIVYLIAQTGTFTPAELSERMLARLRGARTIYK